MLTCKRKLKCHSYDVIKLLSEYIICDSEVFIPVSIGAKIW